MRTFAEKAIGGSLFLICELQEEMLDTVTLGMMENNRISGLLPIVAQQVDGTSRFQFDITGKESLSQCVPKWKNARINLEVLRQIASAVSGLREYMIEESQVVFDNRYIYLEPGKNQVFLTCVPSRSVPDDAIAFRKYCSIVLSTIPVEYRFPAALYQKAVESLEQATFDPASLADQLEKILIHSAVDRSSTAPIILERQNQREPAPYVLQHDPNAAVPQVDHTILPGEQGRDSSEPIVLHRSGQGTGAVLLQKIDSSDQICSVEAMEIDAAATEEMTTPLHQRQPAICGFLRRQSTSEKIEITKTEFRIGKSYHDIDYRIDDNPAVSRYHAKIIQRDGHFFIVDTNSKNHTYVNRCLIESNCEVPLTDATCVRLANEEFVFLINR